MKIVCRTVTGAATEHNVEPTDTIGSIKQKMSAEYDLSSLRLCHKGKVLDDAKTIQDLGFNDGEVLIVAGKKVKAGEAAAAPAAAAAAQPAPAQPKAEPTPAQSSSPAPATPASGAPPAASSPPAPSAPSAPAQSDESGVDPSTIEMIMGMGFDDRAKVVHALRCAYGNGDRAVEYLCSGIPAGVEAQFRQNQARAAQPQVTPQRSAPAPSGGGGASAQQPQGGGGMSAEALGQMMAQMQQQQGGGSDLRRALYGIPQFEQIRALVRNNTAALPTVMQQLQEHHPNVFQLVQASPQEFLDIINEPAGAGGAGGAGGHHEAQQEQLPSLGPEDQPAIERLVALGGGTWDARAASLVYMVCRKNEELAANVLMDNGGLPPELLQALADGAMMEGGEGDDDDDADA